jgi:16S rRNA (uracil1498-N3)-methyltransferase
MNRFFLNKNQFSGETVTFPSDLAHQIVHVLRLGDGDTLEVLDNQGMLYQVDLMITTPEKQVLGKIIHTEPVVPDKRPSVALYFGLSNREKVELILQKATEIGVSEFHPFVSSRTLVQSLDLTDKKKDRWERIIREASEQSRRGYLPKLCQPLDFEGVISAAKNDHALCMIAWEQADTTKHLRQIMANFDGESVALFIGPEGGFSAEEIKQAKTAGCHVVSLGDQILRMETAAIVFPALVLYELGAF